MHIGIPLQCTNLHLYCDIFENSYSVIINNFNSVTKFGMAHRQHVSCIGFFRFVIENLHQGDGIRYHWCNQSNTTNFKQCCHKMYHKIYKRFNYLMCNIQILISGCPHISMACDVTPLVTFKNDWR